MIPNRIASLAVLLLALTLWTAPGTASPGMGTDRLDSQAPFGMTPPSAGDLSVWKSKAGRAPFDQDVVASTKDLVRSAGTGGGDLIETEPNDALAVADAAPDLPFNCTGIISAVNDVDVLSVPVTFGQHLQVNVFSVLFGGIVSPLNPFVSVGFPGELIAFNNDMAAGNVNSQVNFVVPHDGTLYIVVQSAGPAGGPAYHYVVSVLPVVGNTFDLANFESEPNDEFAEADPIVAPGVKIGGCPTSGDLDLMYFDAPAGATVVVDVSARVYGYPTDPFVVLYRQDYRPLFASDDLDGVDSRFNVVLPETGRYYLLVLAENDTVSPTSFYVVSLSFQDSAGSPLVSKIKRTPNGKLKKVVGSGFDPADMTVEVDAVGTPGTSSAASPTTVIKVKPPRPLESEDIVTVVRHNGRRSNPFIVN